VKRKIFISAHPADRFEYLGRVEEAVNRTENCIAVYNPAPNDHDTSFPEDVDALVIIASLKYFVWANSGYESEYIAALLRGIKVIPFMIESSQTLIDLVNMRCGKVQYIDATESMEFALDTLCAHFTATERVIDESLPSVFISYRRADKDHLYRLVKTIKDADAYPEINLWYDEIIAPGENYSQSIMTQLENCNLFVLLVTPNLLEKGNYVWRVEYKTARNLGKRILCVMAEKTDRKKLDEMYGNLGRIVDIKHPAAITSVIAEIAALRKGEKT